MPILPAELKISAGDIIVTWRDRLYLLALYPLEEVPKLLYKLCFFIFLLFVMIGGALFHAYAEEQAASHNESHNTGHTTFLSPKLETAIFQSPRLRQSGARACRAIFVLGQRRADNRVSISASLSGERQLAHNFRTNNDDLSDTSRRAYDRQNDDLLDLELQARYRIMDWGVGSARVRAEEYQLAAERLSYEAGLSETLQDILRLMMQIEGARIDVQYRTNALQEMQPHIEAIEAQGIAGSVGIAEVRAVKLTVLNAEIALQRAERHLSESLNQLQASYQISYEDGLPLLDRFTDLRGDAFIEIEPEDWRNIRILDYRFMAQTEELYAIEHENLPQFDTVLETSIFDVTDYESEYQIVGRLEMSVPLYDGGANNSRSQEKSW
ncbi:MAG: TolC family protein [Candidatus Puniceispirillaceae bacterium]